MNIVCSFVGDHTFNIHHVPHNAVLPCNAHAAEHLTRIARPEWTLTAAEHDHHAAAGAARLANEK